VVTARGQRVTAGPGVGVLGVLGAAAALGGLGGLVLARRAPDPDAVLTLSDRAVARALPAAPAAPRPDMMAPDPLSLRGIPAYPGASPRRITGSTPRGGALNAISWFTTHDSVDRVLGFYEQAWSAANVVHARHRYGEQRGYVAWFEHAHTRDGGPPVFGDGVLHMVAALDEGSQTMVLVSATEPQKLLEAMSPLPPGVRLPPGAGRPQVINLGEAGEERTSVFASCRGSPEEVAGQLEQSLALDGWTVEERAVAPGGRVTVVARQAPRLQIAVVEGGPSGADVLITLEQRPPPAGGRP
jgi:hypothetical protein